MKYVLQSNLKTVLTVNLETGETLFIERFGKSRPLSESEFQSREVFKLQKHKRVRVIKIQEIKIQEPAPQEKVISEPVVSTIVDGQDETKRKKRGNKE